MLVIAGPTATGKSEVAVEVASRMNGEIVNADSVQLYRHCNIGTAKPPDRLRMAVPHYLYDILEPNQDFNAGEYEKLAETMVISIHKRGKLPILVGGTGLYIKALLYGLSIPAPQTAGKLSPHDGVRIMRALEVLEITGKPPSRFASWQPKSWLKAITVALTVPRETLRERIGKRTERMVEEGLVEETRQILAMGYPESSPPLQAIGYRQAVQHLKGNLSIKEMEAEIKKATWRYSRRQRAWFKKEGFTWIDSEKTGSAATEIEFLASATKN